MKEFNKIKNKKEGVKFFDNSPANGCPLLQTGPWPHPLYRQQLIAHITSDEKNKYNSIQILYCKIILTLTSL